MFTEKKHCLLYTELQTIEILTRLVKLKSKRPSLLKMFQYLIEYDTTLLASIITNFEDFHQNSETQGEVLSVGMMLGYFFLDGGWFPQSCHVYKLCEKICKEFAESTNKLLRLLDVYHKSVPEKYPYFSEYTEKYYRPTDTLEVMLLKCRGRMPLIPIKNLSLGGCEQCTGRNE